MSSGANILPSGAEMTSGSISLPSGPAADLKRQITTALNTIDSIKNDPQLSKRISYTIGTVLSPLIQPMANIKHGLLDSVTTYRKVKVNPPGKTTPTRMTTPPGKITPPATPVTGISAGGGTKTLKKSKIGKGALLAPKQMEVIQETTRPSALDRALSFLANIDANLGSINTINDNVSTINTNLSELLKLSKAGSPTANDGTNTTNTNTANTNTANTNTANTNTTNTNTTNNSQEGGRRQTKRTRKGRGRTRR